MYLTNCSLAFVSQVEMQVRLSTHKRHPGIIFYLLSCEEKSVVLYIVITTLNRMGHDYVSKASCYFGNMVDGMPLLCLKVMTYSSIIHILYLTGSYKAIVTMGIRMTTQKLVDDKKGYSRLSTVFVNTLGRENMANMLQTIFSNVF